MFTAVFRKSILATIAASLIFFAGSVFAAQTPHKVIEAKTQEVLGIIKKGKKTFKSNPDAFYQSVERSLDDIVDFRLFARGVMGTHGSAATYNKMSPAEKKKFNQRLDKFSKEFKRGLITKYGSALLLFNGQKIEVAPPSAAAKSLVAQGKTVKVTQYVYTSASKKQKVQYTMKPNSSGKWKVRNITVDPNINIGKIYRRQFAAAMKKHGNDIDKVIKTWSVAPEGVTTPLD